MDNHFERLHFLRKLGRIWDKKNDVQKIISMLDGLECSNKESIEFELEKHLWLVEEDLNNICDKYIEQYFPKFLHAKLKSLPLEGSYSFNGVVESYNNPETYIKALGHAAMLELKKLNKKNQ